MTERRKQLTFVVSLVAVLGVVALTLGPGRTEGRPLDPDGTGELGMKGLVLLLRDLGSSVDVSVGGPNDRHTATLLLRDQMTQEETAALEEWVSRGGTLLVTDPGSSFASESSADPGRHDGDRVSLARRCSLRALQGIDTVQTRAPVPLVVPDEATGCFPFDGGAFMTVKAVGSGRVVALGGPFALVNESLGRSDNAALAAAILAPDPGGSVFVLHARPSGQGQTSLLELIDPKVKAALAQIVIAFLIFAWWRGRRLGLPVAEVQPVNVPGAEMVSSVGRLMQQGHHRTPVVESLRDDLRLLLEDRAGISRSAPLADAVAALTAKTSLSDDSVRRALTQTPADDDQLVELAQTLEQLHQEVVHAR